MFKRISFFFALLLGTLHHPHDVGSGAHLAVRRNKSKAHVIHHRRCH
ncbi:hypothetical protein IFT48_04175 [Pseudomonas fluorescens]|nr:MULTISPECIES: hypothetical protein [Pseudomonas]MBD8089168.1 hypothetical protein [Pseudomonas fluorescens]MBD8615405.1 hypothetical protein [Pseudomonas putida]MBD8681942.1 hypothetical protein [Pseudomonas sp. CFBP 13719]